MTTLPPSESRLATEDFGRHPVQVDALRDGDVVGAVGRRYHVVVAQVVTDTDGGRLLARGEVEFAGNRPGGNVELRLLALQILLLQPLFVVSCRHHVGVHLPKSLFGYHAA